MIKRPNIVILNPDQMRADSLHHLGNEAAVTPILDALSEEGVSFSRAFCQNPVCTPSRCSFMSGWYPHVAGHRTMTHARYKYIRRLYEEDEFYDLERDPKEVHNLIGDSMYQKEISACKEKLLTHLLDTADVVPFQKDVRMEKDFIRVLMS